ncbi:MAG: hypothetical protein CMG75_07835 [Candidatus Marinimicrobia bacterium]|mgnify:CR=1 FL=1|nr:hypothetical protein [Candidatus Neomarinimicrobiota bacterium]|tara:strand:- start:21518 stop:22723 length:1206 start_codon:yes stop_codon:yes gene_type:complete
MDFIFDIINLQFIVAIAFFGVAYSMRNEPLKVFLLFCHILVIFLLNDVLFSPNYFGDQLRQVDATQTIRSELFQTKNTFQKHGPKMGFASLIFAAIPFPFINSVQSLAMINFLIFLAMFLFLRKYKLSNNKVDYFFLIFPSLLLYSSLALRDTLVLFFMLISLYIIIVREKYLWGLLFSSPLLIFKFQNYLMIVASIMLFKYLKNAGGLRYGFLIIFTLAGAFFPDKVPVVSQLYERLETWRLALFYDQYMYDWDYIAKMNVDAYYEPLGTGIVLLYQVLKYFLYMLLKPLIWEVSNPFQLIQSLENIFIFFMIIIVNRYKINNEKIKQKILFLNCLLFVSMTINGLVVFNFGSAVRYKFPFIVVYFVYFFFLLHSEDQLKRRKDAFKNFIWNKSIVPTRY